MLAIGTTGARDRISGMQEDIWVMVPLLHKVSSGKRGTSATYDRAPSIEEECVSSMTRGECSTVNANGQEKCL